MAVTVRIPTPLRKFTDDNETVSAEGGTVQEAIVSLQSQYPALKERLCDDSGNLRKFVNVFLNDEDIRFQDGPATAVKDGDELSIIPAIAGG
ncbi:MAG: molybdopterin synthase sulfur carrier subunit [Phycisphaera sp.]|nr:molybdopterin synthase sulfur carrier subunit [Phycisphaera sp.]